MGAHHNRAKHHRIQGWALPYHCHAEKESAIIDDSKMSRGGEMATGKDETDTMLGDFCSNAQQQCAAAEGLWHCLTGIHAK